MSDRSQRRRDLTVAEIKAAARARLIAEGPGGITLRAIARDMGITAPALYRYYPALDSLIIDVVTDLYIELRQACQTVRDEIPADEHVGRLVAMARQFRRWVLDHPPEAALMFGPPLPGVDQYAEQCLGLTNAGDEFGQIFLDPMLALHLEGRLPARGYHGVELRPGLPPEVSGFFLSVWTQFYGLIMAEAFGHLSWAIDDAEPIFEAELKALTESLIR
jgi:AcrR family transcriptional regulator